MAATRKAPVPMAEQIRLINKCRKSGMTDADWCCENDNSPSKNDKKHPRIIAGSVKDGRYFYSYMPTGVYAELRNASNRRFVLVEEQTKAKNHLQKWIAVYFPEYKGIYTHIDAKGELLVLKQAPTPEEIVRLGVEGIIKIWIDAKLRGNGYKKAMLIVNTAMRSYRKKRM